MGALHFSDEEFNKQILEAKTVALVDFWAPWCGPCKMMGPIFDKVADELGSSAVVAKVNVDESPKIAERYRIMTIPTIIAFKDGREIARQVGLVSKDAILDLLK